MNKYVHIIDADGNRITSLDGNFIDKEELLKQAKEQYPNAAHYIYGGDDILDEFLKGKIYQNGDMIEAPPYIPTPEEIRKTAIDLIKEKYEIKFKKYEESLLRARLVGNDAAVAKIQAIYKSDLVAMTTEMKGV